MLAAAPIGVVLAAMVGLRLSAAAAGDPGVAAALAVAAATMSSVGAAGVGPGRALGGAAAEAGHATLTILWIILPALTLYEYQSRSGGLTRLRRALAAMTDDRRLQALLIAWFFGLFMEGAAGFGTPVALAAPLLVGIGFEPVRAITLALLGHAAGVGFGALGTPALTQIEITGLDPGTLAVATAAATALAGLVLLAAVTRLADPGRPTGSDMGLAAFAAVAFLAPSIAIAAFIGPELPTLAGALIGLGLFLLALRAGGVIRRPGVAGLGADLGPYLGLVALVLAMRLVPPLETALARVVLGWELDGGFGARAAPLTHPGTAMVLCLVAAAMISRRLALLGEAAAAAARRLLPVALALAVMLLLARVMVHGGMIASLAAAAATTGPFWPALAPWIGALGTFVTGSATASAVLFADFQASTARALDLPPGLMMAAQGAGGAVGNVLAPHNIIAGCATVGLVRREGDVLRWTAPTAVLALLTVGAGLTLFAA
jgi:lactate permease